MWLPVTMGGSALLRPARRMNPLPILSMVTVMPASFAHLITRSRPWRSRSVSVRRHTPPFGVAPICANSISDAQRRSPLIRRLSTAGPALRSMTVLMRVLLSIRRGGGLHRGLRALHGARREVLRAQRDCLEVCAERGALDVTSLAGFGTQVAFRVHDLPLAHR